MYDVTTDVFLYVSIYLSIHCKNEGNAKRQSSTLYAGIGSVGVFAVSMVYRLKI